MPGLFVLLLCSLGVLTGCSRPAAPPPAAPDLQTAWTAYRNSDFDKAAQMFLTLQTLPDAPPDIRSEALYGEASCAAHRRTDRNLPGAVALYERLLQEHPESAWAPWAAFDLVRARHLAPSDQDIDYEDLIRGYDAVFQAHPNTPAGEDAFLFATRLGTSRATPERARALIDAIPAFIQAHPRTPYRSPLQRILAECYRFLGEDEKGLDALLLAFEGGGENDPMTPLELFTAYWNIAYTAEFEVGNFEVARRYYNLLLRDFPNDDRSFACREALRRMDRIEDALRRGEEPAPHLLLASPR